MCRFYLESHLVWQEKYDFKVWFNIIKYKYVKGVIANSKSLALKDYSQQIAYGFNFCNFFIYFKFHKFETWKLIIN